MYGTKQSCLDDLEPLEKLKAVLPRTSAFYFHLRLRPRLSHPGKHRVIVTLELSNMDLDGVRSAVATIGKANIQLGFRVKATVPPVAFLCRLQLLTTLK